MPVYLWKMTCTGILLENYTMKKLRNILSLAALFIAIQVNGQTDKETTIKIINNQHYIFNATTAIPMANREVNEVLSRMPGGTGGTIQLLGSKYELSVAKDSVEAFLPYYGRAYTATMNPDDSGIKFKSKKFEYKAVQRKKGAWLITMKFKDTKDPQTMTLSVSENGYATLHVNSNNRQAITFSGFLSEPKAKP